MENIQLSFVQHLDELRKRIIICLLGIIAASIVSYFFVGKLIPYLAEPVGRLVFIQPLEAFITYLKIALICGFCLSLPLILYQVWAFICSGLTVRERRYIYLYAPLSLLLFLIGAIFAYKVIVPYGLKFLLSFGGPYIQPMISVSRYISFLGMMLLAFGVAFELPVVVMFLTKLGLVTPQFLRKKRKYVLLGIFILAALLTPPDIFTQLLMALPLILLYELSILLTMIIRNRD